MTTPLSYSVLTSEGVPNHLGEKSGTEPAGIATLSFLGGVGSGNGLEGFEGIPAVNRRKPFSSFPKTS